MDMKHCPYLDKKCIGDDCAMYTHIRGKNPQSEEEIDTPGCSIAFLPILLLNETQQMRQMGAATEGLRNKINEANNINIQVVNSVKESIDSLVEAQKQTREVIKLAAHTLTQKAISSP